MGARPTATGTNTGEYSDLSDDEKLPAPAKTLDFTQYQDKVESALDEEPPATRKLEKVKHFSQYRDKVESALDEEPPATRKLEKVKPTAPLKMADNTKAGLPLNSGECGV
jgi:hypothetical protein